MRQDYLQELEKHLEINRQQAEAQLLSEEKGFILLNEKERSRLKERAKGVIPERLEHHFLELLSIPFLTSEAIFQEASSFIDKLSAIEKIFGSHTSFTYAVALLSERNTQGLLTLASLFEELYLLIQSPAGILAKIKIGKEQTSTPLEKRFRFRLLQALHTEIIKLRPKVSFAEINLAEAIRRYIKKSSIPFFYLTIIESYILKRAKFKINFIKLSNGFELEIILDRQPVYWELTSSHPLSFISLEGGNRIGFDEFLVDYIFFLSSFSDPDYQEKILEFAKEIAAKKQKSHYSSILTQLSLLYMKKNEFIKARDLAQTLCQLEPCSPFSHLLLGNVFAKKGDFKKALAKYNQALEIYAQKEEKEKDDISMLAQIYCNMGFVYLALSDQEKAIKVFFEAIEVSPQYFEPYYNLGNIFLQNKDYHAAEKMFLKAEKINPNFLNVYFNLGTLYWEWNKKNKALSYYKKVISLEPNHYGAWYNLALVYRDLGKKRQAVAALEKAISLNPNLAR